MVNYDVELIVSDFLFISYMPLEGLAIYALDPLAYLFNTDSV